LILVDSSVWIDYFTGTDTVDAIIATYCIEKGLPLLSADRDFKPFHEHLKLKNAASL
jgi:predicted nucleic acid-binding protein